MEEQQSLKHRYVVPTLIFSTITAIVGSFLIIPPEGTTNFGFFLWLCLIMGGNLIALHKIFGKLNFNPFNIMLLVSYFFLSLGFVVNTKQHFMNLFLAAILFPIINVNLVSNILRKNFIFTFIYGALYFMYSKAVGAFVFIKDYFEYKVNDKSPKSIRKLLPGLKVFGIFLITGLPVIFIVIGLLKSTNEGFAQFIDDYLSIDISIGTNFIRFMFIMITLPYFLTEGFLLREKARLQNDLKNNKIKTSKETRKTWVLVTLMTVVILNLFYIIFVVAELKADATNVRDLIFQKGYNSYSQLAVSRFWELIWVSIINLGIIYLVAKPFRVIAKLKESVVLKVFMVNAAFLFINTMFLIFSAHKRLALYEQGYGFTNKRFFGHTFLIILVIVSVLVFSALVVRKYNKQFQLSLGILILFIATHLMLPTEYIINKLNYNSMLANDKSIVVYDPIYTVKNPYGYYYDENGSLGSNGLTRNDINSYDGYFVAVDLLKSDKFNLTDTQRNFLREEIREFYRDNSDKSWRDFNITESLLLDKIEEADLD